MTKSKNTSEKFLRVSLVTGVIFLATFAFIFYKKLITAGEIETNSDVSQEPPVEQDRQWEEYRNSRFGFSLEIPRLLYKTEWENEGEYDFFVRFDENQFALGKGVAVGVKKTTLEEEEKRITDVLVGEGAKLAARSEKEISGTKGVRLDFESEKDGEEPRTVSLAAMGDYVYSISTHPEQIEKVLEFFRLTNTQVDWKGVLCGGIANLPCPSGFKCVLDGDYPDAGGKCVKE